MVGMARKTPGEALEKQSKRTLLAILIAAFGLLLFIALALTLPWNK
jgi:hypothetical protein